ncbi:MAG: molybdopterin converting factor subunit 1 [Bacteroidia bacterium]|jgi:molybdopterin converting factor subunit 1
MKLLTFGITRDIIGETDKNMTLPPDTTVGELKKILSVSYPELIKLNALAIAVNEVYATDDVSIDTNDVVALIPPVSGG